MHTVLPYSTYEPYIHHERSLEAKKYQVLCSKCDEFNAKKRGALATITSRSSLLHHVKCDTLKVVPRTTLKKRETNNNDDLILELY